MVSGIFTGLTEEEVRLNREQFGSNTSENEKQNTFWEVVKEIVTEPLFAILVCAVIIYFILGDYNEGIIMLVSLGFISGISVYQGNKSRNAVDELKKLSNPRAKVIRNGIIVEVATEEIVMLDLFVVEDGNMVPADGLILEAHDFSVNESILTGESLPVLKDLQKKDNKIFQGTMVTTGSCIAQVSAIGKQSELGKIGQSLREIVVSKTPLQQQIRSFVRSMVGIGVIAFVVVWAINYYLSKSILHGLLHGLTIAMSVLPEEIPVAFSTFMALGAYHLYKKKVITKSPNTVEALGAATVICTDKTGTITENEMQLSAIYDFSEDRIYDYTREPFNHTPVLEYAMWASESNPFDMMEKAIHHVYASTAENDRRADYSMSHEYPLDGQPPMMTHVFSNRVNHHIIACKGGVEGILRQSDLTENVKSNILKKTDEFASKGFRVLAVAKSDHDIQHLPVSQLDFKLNFLGLVAFYDPPKQGMKQTLREFYQAGIQVKMITGDYPETALAIARQIEFKTGHGFLTGKDVVEMNPDQLREKVKDTNIFVRMFPDAKLKIIEALKSNGEVVAMTGDGVNDGPALKASHIGIAMGLRGSEIAKKAASLILMDDDLSHMVDAVALGRRIYENLKKAIQYIISIHIPIILTVTLPLLFFWKFTDFFSPIHVIFLELIMGPTCSIIFENEPIEAGSMYRQPRKMSMSFFSIRELSLSIIQGMVITSACLGSGYYFMSLNNNEAMVRTAIYATLIFSNLFLTLVNRSFYYSVITTLKYRNRLIPLVLFLSLLVLFLSIYLHSVRTIFQFEELNTEQLMICLASAFAGVMWVEGVKFLKRKRNKTKMEIR
jgi:Ca2+-transporting ATPase